MNKKSLFVLVLALVMVLVSACGGAGNTNTNNGKGSNDNGNTDTAAGEQDTVKKNLELHMFASTQSDQVYAEGEDENNNMFEDLVKEKTDVQLYIDALVPAKESIQNKYNLAIAADNAPDIMGGETPYIAQLVRSGALQPLDGLIEEYGSDKLKEWLNYRDGDGLKPLTFDGKLYAFPIYRHSDQNSMHLFLRKDWLDQVSMDVPTTLNDLHDVLEAFVNNDPNQSGKKDTLGLVMTNKVGGPWAASVDPILGALGAVQEYWIEKDGKLVYGSIQPEMKDGLALLQQWYDEGLIDAEFAVNQENEALEKVSANKTGAYFSPAWDAGWNIENSKKNDPDAEWIIAEIPTGPDGKQGRRGDPLTAGGQGLYTNSENGEAFIKYANAILGDPDVYNATKIGYEGFNYVINDEGVPVKPEDYVAIRYPYPGFLKWPDELINYVLKDKEDWTLLDYKLDATEPPLKTEGNKKAIETRDANIYNKFTGAPTETMQAKYSVLNKQEMETFVKIIMGEPLSTFDEFVANWKKLGGDKITEEVNEWYDSVK